MSRESTINPDLEKYLKAMMKEAFDKDSTVGMEDKLKLLDRVIKVEQLKAKIKDDEFGKDFDLGDDK